MYVVIRRFTGASALVDAMIQREQEVRDLISTVPGFRSYCAARSGSGDGGVVTVTICDTKAGTDESTRRAIDWTQKNVSGASIGRPEITEGETYINF